MRDKVILSRFVQFAGGPDGHVVISTASSLGDRATQVYRDLFTGLGVGTVTVCARRSGTKPTIRRPPRCCEKPPVSTSPVGTSPD